MKDLFRKYSSLRLMLAVALLMIATATSAKLLYGDVGSVYSTTKEVADTELIEGQKQAMSDPLVSSFVADEVFSTDEWKAFTAINGWGSKRADLRSRIEHLVSTKAPWGMSDHTEQFLTSALDKPWAQEFPVYESILRSAAKACTSKSQTPAEYIEAHRNEGDSVLQFAPSTAADTDIVSRAYVASASAAVRHLCPTPE